MKVIFQEYATAIVAFFMSVILIAVLIAVPSDDNFRLGMDVNELAGDGEGIKSSLVAEEKKTASLKLKNLTLIKGEYPEALLKNHIIESASDENGNPVSIDRVNISLKGVDTAKSGEYRVAVTMPFSSGVGVLKKTAIVRIVETISTDNGNFFLSGRSFQVKKKSMTWKQWSLTPQGEEFDLEVIENNVFSKTYGLWIFDSRSDRFVMSSDVITTGGNYVLLPYETQ